MKTLLALLLLIPSLSWGKDLSGNKLWCSSENILIKVEPTYMVLDFINEGLAYWYRISRYGINKWPADYDVHIANISLRNHSTYVMIDRKTLVMYKGGGSPISQCEIVEISDTEKYVNDFFYKEYESKNKL